MIEIVDNNRAFRFGSGKNVVRRVDGVAFDRIDRIAGRAQYLACPSRARCDNRVIAVEIDDITIFAVLLSSWSNVPGDASIVVGRQSSIPLIRQMAEATQNSAEIFELIQRRQYELVEEEEEGGG